MNPYIVYPAQRLTGIDYEKFPDALYSNTATGWMNQNEVDIWIKCFNDYVNSLKVHVTKKNIKKLIHVK